MYAYYQPNSKTDYSKKSKFGILNVLSLKNAMLFENFYKNQTNDPSTRIHKRIWILYGLQAIFIVYVF